jgi:hypothetical protein
MFFSLALLGDDITSGELHAIAFDFSFPGSHFDLEFAHRSSDFHLTSPVEKKALSEAAIYETESAKDSIMLTGFLSDIDYSRAHTLKRVLSVIPKVAVNG